MLKKILISMVLLTTTTTFAKELSVQDIRDRYQLNADVYTVHGKRIISGPEVTNYWQPDRETGIIKGDWSSDSNERKFALRYHFQVTNERSIQAVIKEYSSQTSTPDGPEFKNLLEKKEYTLTNLEPIVWKIKNDKGQNLIVRFFVSMRDVTQPISVDSLPVAGNGISVSDNAGFLWAEGVEFNGKYVGLTSHRGTLVLSYVPFADAKELGVAEGNKISIKIDKKFHVSLNGATSFLPAGVTAKVYAAYLPEKKSKSFNSLRTFTSSKEDRIKEVLKK
jgi:hypothetical protein